MRPVTVSKTGVGNSAPIVLDYHLTPEQTGLQAIVTGTVTYTVDYSLDDPFAVYATDYNTNAKWWPHPNMTDQTADSQDVLTVPSRAARVRITSGTGSVALTAVQAGGIA